MGQAGSSALPGVWGSWRTLAIALLALGLQFQHAVPFGVAGVNLCGSDVVAAVLAGVLLWNTLLCGQRPVCASPWLGLALTAASAMLAIGVVVSFQRLGFVSRWALGTKLIGWFGLLSYLCAGLWVGSLGREWGRRCFMQWLVAATLGTGVLAVVLAVDMAPFSFVPASLTHFPVRGFTDNRNAFIFLQLAALAFLLAQGWLPRPVISGRLREVLMAVAGVVIFYSGSRSGVPAMAIMVALALALGALRLPTLLRACAYGVACWLGVEGLRLLCIWLVRLSATGALPPLAVEGPALILSDTTHGSSDSERWSSYVTAFGMWRDSPLFGAGLGTFVETFSARHGRPLVIHNTALWLLTEIGVVGLAIFLALGWALVRPLFPIRRPGDDFGATVRLVALLLALVFAIMAQVHEMLYQRVLWLMFGLALAVPADKDRSLCAA